MKLVVLDANAFWTEQLYSACARFADVLLLKPRDFRAHHQLHGTWWSDPAPRKVHERVWEQRFSMPPGWMFSLWPLAERRLATHVRQFVGRDRFMLIITYPQYRSLVRTLRPALSIYYNLDDYSDNWPSRGKAMMDWERETVTETDLTVCIAQHRQQQLQQRVPEKAGRIFHLPLGCTPEFMAESVHSPPPPALAALPRPLAGYVGALNWRFDYALLADVAEQLPNVTFALGGKVPAKSDGNSEWREGLERAHNLPNVHFLGWIDHARLGEFLNSFDVLFMSYARCNFNANACPAKLWDFLGTGKPIVANDANPETLLWRDVVHIGETPAAFAEKIRLTLQREPGELRQRRLAIAHEHTWEMLSRRMEKVLRVDQ